MRVGVCTRDGVRMRDGACRTERAVLEDFGRKRASWLDV